MRVEHDPCWLWIHTSSAKVLDNMLCSTLV